MMQASGYLSAPCQHSSTEAPFLQLLHFIIDGRQIILSHQTNQESETGL
jgi:hypothetical protein